jgi:NAD(P)-dependent dehydrogenase (short-subunit alcohol dehydrogenase family)
VAPGFVPFEDRDFTQSGEGRVADTPARRAGTSEDIADAVVYFLSTTNYVTGQTLAVDGGLSLR